MFGIFLKFFDFFISYFFLFFYLAHLWSIFTDLNFVSVALSLQTVPHCLLTSNVSAKDVAGAFYEISFDLLTRKLRDQINKWFDMFFGHT